MWVLAICMALSVIVIRLQAAKKPTSPGKILAPSMAMSTGFIMFVDPVMRIPWLYGIEALIVGVTFSYPLMTTSQMYISGREIYLKRSKGFIVVMIALLVARTALHGVIDHYLTIAQTSSVFFILAFGMLIPWRIAMFHQYRKISRKIPTSILRKATT
ncbi:protein CcdC [Alicyclobacillus fastidiosus]|nr:protein CcdC [Alicyclobacillus fastidiosus]